MKEIEIKFRVKKLDETRSRLQKLGARLMWKGMEESRFFDTPTGDLRKRGQMIRLRKNENYKNTFTIKTPSAEDGKRHKIKNELEITIDDISTAQKILRSLGFTKEYFRYKKYREHWRINGASIELDKTRGGCFVEIEASKQAIDRLAKKLGLDWAQSTTKGYVSILKKHRNRKGK